MWWIKMSQDKLLIIARGPSASGKSYLVNELSKKHNVQPISADHFFMQDGVYKFDATQLRQAHMQAQSKARSSMESGQPVVIIDNTNVSARDMKPYVEMAVKYGYRVEFIEPNWHKDLKKQDGTWNVDFLFNNQNQPTRDKIVPREALERQVGRYVYNPTVDLILNN